MLIRPATRDDLAYLEAHQRDSTRQDILDTGRVHEPFWKVWPAEKSKRLWAVVSDRDLCAAIVGVAPYPGREETEAFLWMAGSAELDRQSLGFLRCSNQFLDLWYTHDPWQSLRTLVSSNNQLSHRWITQWLGFAVVKTYTSPSPPWFDFYECLHLREQWVAGRRGRAAGPPRSSPSSRGNRSQPRPLRGRVPVRGERTSQWAVPKLPSPLRPRLPAVLRHRLLKGTGGPRPSPAGSVRSSFSPGVCSAAGSPTSKPVSR